MTDLLRALMQATGEDPDGDTSHKPEVSPLGKIVRLRELAPRFLDPKVPFKPGDLVTSRPDAPVKSLRGDPALVLEVFDDERRNLDDRVSEMPCAFRPNLVLLVIAGDHIGPIVCDAAFFEPYTGEGADL